MPTILIADDDPRIVEMLRMTLAYEGYAVSVAHDGEAALRQARLARPDLVVLDWLMPRRSGVDVARALQAETIAGYERSLKITQKRYDAGIAARTAVNSRVSQGCNTAFGHAVTPARRTRPSFGWNSVRTLAVPSRRYSCGSRAGAPAGCPSA